jgi:hypothetical protein
MIISTQNANLSGAAIAQAAMNMLIAFTSP